MPLRERGIDVEFAVMHQRTTGVADEAQQLTRVHYLDGSRRSNLKKLRSLLRTKHHDLVHTTLFEADLLGRAASLRTGIPVLTSLVNTTYDASRLDDPNIRRSRLAAARLIDGVSGRVFTDHWHAISETVARSATDKLHVSRNKITVIPRGRDRQRLGVRSDERRSQVRARLGVSDDSIMLLSVGRQEYQKGQVYAIEALALLRQHLPNVYLFVAGRDGNATASIHSAIASNGCAESVSLLGHTDDVPDLLVAADLLVFPSLYEGLGGTLIEAMALGTPIVTSDLDVTREVTAGSAKLVRSGDPAAIADGVRAVLSDAGLRASMAKGGRQQFSERFELGAVMDATATMMRRIAASTDPQ